MKTRFWIKFVAILISATACNSKKQVISEYFPIDSGNRWVYKKYMPLSGDSDLKDSLVVTVLTASSSDSGATARFRFDRNTFRTSSTYEKTFKIDTRGDVYEIVNGHETPLYLFSAKVGDVWSYESIDITNQSPEIFTVTMISVGDTLKFAFSSNNFTDSNYERTFVKGIGLVEIQSTINQSGFRLKSFLK